MTDETDALVEQLTEALIRPLVRCSDLPEWMQTPALGRDMRPLAEYLAEAVAPFVADRTAAALALCDQATPAVEGMPLECTNACMDDLCNCGGKMRPLGWTLNPNEVRAALGGQR